MQPVPPPPPASLPSPAKRLWITVTVMAATLMQVLDTTIANVALPHMQATLGATQESIAWVLTSYIVASAIATPVTGWLEGRFGRRALFTTAIIGFTVSSAACGLAPSLEAMVAARLFQGIFGAFIGPIAQATLLDVYPVEKHAKAQMIFGLGIMIGPIMGPVLGGWLTERWDWRWVFFINVPIGIVVTFAVLGLVRPTVRRMQRFDIFGFSMLALALAAFQLMLDRGSQLDWFTSPEIILEAIVAISALWVFGIHALTAEAPIVPLALFRDRNFVFANVFMITIAAVVMGGAALVTPMLQRIMGYGTMDAGMLIAPRGLAMGVSMIVTARLIALVDVRLLVGGGFLLTGLSLWMMTGFSLDMDSHLIVTSGVVQGFGVGMIFLPMNLIAFSTLAPRLRTDAASLYGLSRSIGGSISISILTALIARNVQVSHSDMSAHVTAMTLPFLNTGMIEQFGMRGETLAAMIDGEINRQALMIAYIDDYWLMSWGALLIAPLVLLMKPAKKGDAPIMMSE
ncbi:DHA2 family efflux MFS transporter permease subunit [Sphingomonas solaris]|uniref:DHA2 family efflux MFS transporter permease subunit n=1 Tax=Alterirhizorhabdus solaris TaxID=2529389 RepID=A0A558R7U8_9SPHN|nr:DHA2 family efflux MFS transporter permease subunit [Sphingomonas solaris]TVV75382.1 DHA2 family efflux MFS transporter permease subunit [Sphingomonas solaris]